MRPASRIGSVHLAKVRAARALLPAVIVAVQGADGNRPIEACEPPGDEARFFSAVQTLQRALAMYAEVLQETAQFRLLCQRGVDFLEMGDAVVRAACLSSDPELATAVALDTRLRAIARSIPAGPPRSDRQEDSPPRVLNLSSR